MCINAAEQERTRLLSILCVLIQRQDNHVAITFGEINSLDQNTQLSQSDPTDVGFALSTRIVKPQ